MLLGLQTVSSWRLLPTTRQFEYGASNLYVHLLYEQSSIPVEWLTMALLPDVNRESIERAHKLCFLRQFQSSIEPVSVGGV